MIRKKIPLDPPLRKGGTILIILCVILLIAPAYAGAKMRVYPQSIDAAFEYDNNVSRERLQKDYQYGIIWRLYTGFGIENFIPVKGLDTRAEYTLGMRDVNTTNDEDYNSHSATLSSATRLKTGTSISLKEAFNIKNSQSDLFNFYDLACEIGIDQPLGRKTTAHLSYKNEQKWFQNDVPEIQARNFIYHQMGLDMYHSMSNSFKVQVGYIHQLSMYNRRPIDFKGGRPIVLEGEQRDRQNVISLGFQAFLLNNSTTLGMLTQVVSSSSNSRAFNFSGNRTRIILLSEPTRLLSQSTRKFYVWFTYQIVAYNLEAYQTPTLGYELSEIRTDDQSNIKLGATYGISNQMSLQLSYEHIVNTVFFTREYYEKDTFSTGLNIKF